jgi:hypothetical protein
VTHKMKDWLGSRKKSQNVAKDSDEILGGWWSTQYGVVRKGKEETRGRDVFVYISKLAVGFAWQMDT